MSLREDLLPVVSELRQLPVDFGLRRYLVTIRRRVWSGTYPGDGMPTNQDIVLTPIPRVRNSFSSTSLSPAALQYILANGNVIDDRYYKIDRITPAFSGGTTGGYTPQQLRMRASPDAKNIEEIVVLVGDDGYRRDCVQVTFEQDRAFGYTMLVHESDRPRVELVSLAITPSPLVVGVGSTLQLTCTGTFADNTESDLTPLVTWSSDSAHASVDLLGVLSGLTTGSATISAALTGVSTSAAVTVL